MNTAALLTPHSSSLSLKLDLGAGAHSPPGFRPMGNAHQTPIFPLPYPDESVDEIRASHCLEHFDAATVPHVLADWTRALKKGGRLRVAVPDLEKIAANYLNGVAQPTAGYIMGGQTDAADFHKSVFDRDVLKRLFSANDLVLIRDWKSELDDCAALPISLNLEARKPHVTELKVSGAMSAPRLGFMDNFFCVMQSAQACKVEMHKGGGAFWGQTLTNLIEHVHDMDDPDLVLTIDYDSVFKPSQLAALIQMMMLYPEIDALAPIQSSRHLKTALFTLRRNGTNAPRLSRETFAPDTTPVSTAHFGLTLLRAKKLKALPKPWFHSVPSPTGEWKTDDGHIDEDINFWRKWEAAGNSLHLANRIAIGHAELTIRWPDANLEVMHQPFNGPDGWHELGIPDGVWS